MNTKEFSKIINLLKISYNKNYTKEELETMYDFLKDYDYYIMNKAVRILISKSNYVPNIAQIINEYKETKKEMNYEMIEKAKELGNIKSELELDKAIKFLDKGITPVWLDKEIKEDKITNEQALELLDGWEW